MNKFIFDVQRFDNFNNAENDKLITGTANADSISNSGQNVTIEAQGGDDTITNDIATSYAKIFGGDGNDNIKNEGEQIIINGGAGNDNISNYNEEVTIDGGAGDDTIDAGGYGIVYIYNDGDGNDLIKGLVSPSLLLIIGDGTGTYSTVTSGDDLIVTVGKGNVTLQGASDLGELNIQGSLASAGNTSWATISNSGGSTILSTSETVANGTTGNDIITTATIEGDTTARAINGNGGNDNIVNVLSNATIKTTDGKDFIGNINNNKTFIDSGVGDDNILNSLHYEIVTLGSGETLSNPYGDTSIVAGTGNDTVVAVGGNKVSISAGEGDDYIAAFHSYYQTVDGGAGNDSIEIAEGHSEYILGGDGADTIIGTILYETLKGDWAMGGHATIDGGAGADYISVGYSNNASINGGADDDTIITYGENSEIDGGKGDDEISLISNGETTLTSAGTTISGGAGDDTITGDGSGIVYKYNSGGGNDVITGFTENDTLVIADSDYLQFAIGDDVIVTDGEGLITLKDAATLDNLHIKGNDTVAAATFIEVLQKKTDEGYPIIAGLFFHPHEYHGFETLPSSYYASSETMTINSSEGFELTAYHYTPANPNDKWVILVHGYGHNHKHMNGFAQQYLANNYHVLEVDQRAAGDSEGEWLTMGAAEGEDVARWTHKIAKINPNAKIVLHGVSMGAATAMLAAANSGLTNVTSLIEDCGYTRVLDLIGLVKDFIPALGETAFVNLANDVSGSLTGGYKWTAAAPIDSLGSATMPSMFITGTKDQVINPSMLDSLYSASGAEVKEIFTVEGATHGVSALQDSIGYGNAVFRFNAEAAGEGWVTSNVTDSISLRGTKYDDTITSSGSNVTINTGVGDDTITNSGSNVSIDAGDGENLITESGNNNHIVFNGNTTVDGFNYGFGDGADTVYFNVSKKTSAPACDFKEGGIVFYNSNASLTFADKTDTTKLNFYYAPETQHVKGIFIPDDTWYTATSEDFAGNAELYFVGASAKINHGVDFGGISDALNISLDSDYEATNISYWVNNVYSVKGGAGLTTITGSTNNDTIIAGTGAITINGGKGDDYISLSSGAAVIQYTDGDGNDLIQNFGTNATLSIGDGTGEYSTIASNNDLLVAVGEETITVKDAATLDALNIQGTHVTAQEINNTVDGATVTGTPLADTISNHGSNVTVQALGGNDYISNVDNNKTFIDAGAGDDFILNSLYYNVLTDEKGGQTLESPYSGTTIDAGAGNDTINISGGSTINVSMGDGDDKVSLRHSYYTTIDGGVGDDFIEITEGDHENISGGDDADTIIGTIASNTITSSWAMGGHATIDGGAGADYISVGYSNNASINGGEGNDSIITYGINSKINGGDGDDAITLITNPERPTLTSAGTTISGGTGNDTITVDDSDIVFKYSAGDGDDVINGITDNDTLVIDGDTYHTKISGNDKIISIVGAQNTITLKDAATVTANIIGDKLTVPSDRDGTEIENPVATIEIDGVTYYYESVARATNDAQNNSTVTVIKDSTETSTINATKGLTIQFNESGLGVYSVSGGDFVSAENVADFTVNSIISSGGNYLSIRNGSTATFNGYQVTGTSSGYIFGLQDNSAIINGVTYGGAGNAIFDNKNNVTLTSGAIVNDESLITSDTGIVLAAGNYTLNGNAITTTAMQTVYLDSDGAHFNVTSDTITYNAFTLNGSGAASISGDLPTLTAGVEVNRDERAMVVLTEKGYNTINGRGYQMTEKLSEGITVGAVDNGIGAAHIVPYESFPEDAGKTFAEEALIYGDDSYTVRLDKDGIKSIYGISNGSTVRGTAYLNGEIDTTGSILQLAIDGAGNYTFGDKTYTIGGAIDSVNVAALTARFYNDNTAALRQVYYLNGTISGDFTNAVTINQASMPLQVLGDNLINIVATDSVNASVDANSSKISSAGNASVITGLNSGATVAFAGGATKVTTEEEGSFVFRSSGDTQQAFTVSGDSSVDFILRNYTDENGKPTMQVEGVNNFENGYYSFNSDTAYHGINVGETIKASDELEMVFSDVATFTIADSKIVSVSGIDGTINNLTSDVTVHATGAMTVNKVYANVTGDTDYNILVENSTTTGLVNISSGASVSVANIFVTTDNNGDFKVGENNYSINDTVDGSVTFATGYNGAVENVTNFAGTMKTSAQSVTVNSMAFTTSNTDASIISAGTGISRVEGLTSGDTVSGNLDTTTILMPSISDSDVSTLTITNTSYTLASDANGVEITGKRIDGLDYGASLQTNAAGVYTVNGTTLTAKVGDIFIGTSEGAAYIYDPNNIPLDANTMTTEEIAAQAGISENYLSEETNTAKANSMVADDGDKSLNGNYAVAIDNTGGNITQTVDFSNTTGRKKVTLGGGAQDVSFNNEGGNVAVITSSDEEEKNINLGNGGDLVIVEETSTPVNINAGTGSDSIVTAGNNVNVNMNGGATKIIPNSGTVNLNNYDASTGAGIYANEYADIARAVVGGNINFGDGAVSFGGSTVYFANNDASSYSMNIFDNKGERHKVGYTNSAGGNLDTSGEREGRLLVGNKDGNKGASTFTAGSGDDTAIGGAGDNFDLGAGNNTLYLNENRDNAETGATINQTATSGKTEVTGFSGGFNENSDRINIDLSASVSFKNGKLTFSLFSATLEINFGGTSSSADLIADENFVDGTTIDEISPITYEQGDYQFDAESLTAASDYQTLASAQ